VKRGLLGVNIFSLTPDMAKSLNLQNVEGVLVSQVTEGSAAEKAGIKPGDVITSINGQSIKSNSGLRNAIGLSRVGDKLEVSLVRERKTMQVTAVITEPPPTTKVGSSRSEPATSANSGPIHPAFEGASLADAEGGGVEIRAVEPRSAAAAWFRKGDRIEGANRDSVKNLDDLRGVAKGGGALVLRIRRGNAQVLVPLRAP
jgi:S1-C subfamily serine protease